MVDVLVVALLLYNLLLLIRGTRAVQVVIGILVLVLIYYSARTLELPALETTFENLLIILPLAILVLFQHEIRRALANFGRNPLWGLGHRRKRWPKRCTRWPSPPAPCPSGGSAR